MIEDNIFITSRVERVVAAYASRTCFVECRNGEGVCYHNDRERYERKYFSMDNNGEILRPKDGFIYKPDIRCIYFQNLDKNVYVEEKIVQRRDLYECVFCEQEAFYNNQQEEFYCPICNGVPWENHLLTNTDLNR